MLLQGDRTSSAFSGVEESLETAEDEESNVDQDGCEDGVGNSLAILGIIDTAGKLFVVASVQTGESAKDNNGENGENSASPRVEGADDGLHDGRLKEKLGNFYAIEVSLRGLKR